LKDGLRPGVFGEDGFEQDIHVSAAKHLTGGDLLAGESDMENGGPAACQDLLRLEEDVVFQTPAADGSDEGSVAFDQKPGAHRAWCGSRLADDPRQNGFLSGGQRAH
jgi:hypothetical protein